MSIRAGQNGTSDQFLCSPQGTKHPWSTPYRSTVRLHSLYRGCSLSNASLLDLQHLRIGVGSSNDLHHQYPFRPTMLVKRRDQDYGITFCKHDLENTTWLDTRGRFSLRLIILLSVMKGTRNSSGRLLGMCVTLIRFC